MVSEYQIENRRKNYWNKIRRKLTEKSRLYLEKIEELKIKNEQRYLDRSKEFNQKYQMKEQSIMNIIKLTQDKMREKRRKVRAVGRKKMDDVMKNLDEFHRIQEEKRLQLEKENFSKSKIIFNITYKFCCWL